MVTCERVEAVAARDFQLEQRHRFFVGMTLANHGVIGGSVSNKLRLHFVAQQCRCHAHGTRCIHHMHDRMFVIGRDLHGSVHA